MARYSDQLIDEIRSSNDIVDVISQYVTLKRSGRNYFGLCPFHKENTPSFSVSPEKQIFHCFGCGKGGNVIHFISNIENLDFKDTLEFLADRVGITLKSTEDEKDTKQQLLKAKIYEINQEAAIFYHENLYNQVKSKIAQDYVKKRKLDNKTLKSFLIGYSSDFDELYRYLKSKGFNEEELISSNLVLKNDNGQYMDRFRKRLMFPILDLRNRVIAFGGRKLDDTSKAAKYINTAENLVYSKGRNLYGLNIAKNSDSKKLIIVEGYMDAVSLHQRGITNAVASLGTALTEAQGRLLRKYSEEVIISYDSDSAGQSATMRGLEILSNLGCNLRILQMEGAKDPDEYVIQHGSAGFNELIDKAISLVEFKVKVLRKQLDIENINEKIKFLNEIAKVLSTVTNKIEQEIYIERISKEYGISKEAIYAEVNKLQGIEKISPKILNNVPTVKNKKIDNLTTKREDLIIKFLINEKNNVYEKIRTYITVDDIKTELEHRIVSKLYDEYEKNGQISDVFKLFNNEEEIGKITEIMAENYEFTDIEKGVKDLIKIYSQDKLTDRRNEILTKMKDESLNKEEIMNLENELSSIIIEMAKIK